MKLAVRGLRWSAQGHEIVRGVDLEVAEGECVGIIGPNGSGKSSLLRCVCRMRRPDAGTVLLDGDDVWRMQAAELARRAATLPQEMPGRLEFTVREIVSMGRYPHKRALERENGDDRRLVAEALEAVGLADRAERLFASLSGGEKQRALIGRAIAQGAGLLILDEPTNHLDIHYQLEIMEVIRGLGRSCLMVMHDLNLAAQYCDRLYVLAEGRVAAEGAPAQVFTPDLVRRVYRVEARISPDPDTGRPRILFQSAR